MAVKNKKTQKKQVKRRGRRKFLTSVLLLALLCACAFTLYMHACAKITRISRADVYLPDLPASFENTKVLFISDFDIRTAGDLKACKNLMEKVEALQPDILLLGGDYSADTLVDVLNGRKNPESGALAAEFIRSLADFNAPLGKFAVTGENDTENTALAAAFGQAGIKYLSDRCEVVKRGNDQLVIAGLSDVSLKQTKYASLGGVFSGNECVIAVAHNPVAYVGVRVAEARGGGAWADLVLTGHNLGGQINLFGRSVRTMTDQEKRTVSGWFYPDDLPLLVSQGLGCKGPMLRLDSKSEIHLLTLKNQKTLPAQEIYLPVFE
ncbi:MAG: hypothetical protein IJA26_04590 [Clostridia bacterium]|nr:hypothetical protein [Clostridia bacterium]